MRQHTIPLVFSLILLVVVGTSCGQATEVPPTALPPATATLPLPSATATSPLPSATAALPTLPPPTNTPLPPTATATAAPPTPTPVSEPQPVRIQFASGATSAVVEGNVPPGEINRYVLKALAGQTMMVYLTPYREGQALLVIWGADGTVLISDHAETTMWSGKLPSTQDYYVDVKAAAGGTAVDYALQVVIPVRIQFALGATSATVHGGTPPGGTDSYVLSAMAGQTMTVRLTLVHGLGLIVIWGEDGTVLISDHAGATEWTGVLPSTQDYFVDVRAAADSPLIDYGLEVVIPPGP